MGGPFSLGLPVPSSLVGAGEDANASVSRVGRPPGFGHPAAAARLAGVGQLGAEWSVEGFAALVRGWLYAMGGGRGGLGAQLSCAVWLGSPGPVRSVLAS